MATKELNTLAPIKYTYNYSDASPTLDTDDGILVGDFAIDNSTTPYDIWQCYDNTSGSPVWKEDLLQSNVTVNFNSSMSASEIQALIDEQPKNLNDYILTFQFADGTYTLANTLTFSGFEEGVLRIYGNTSETNATSLHTTQQVYLNATSASDTAINVEYCSCFVRVWNLKIQIADVVSGYALGITTCPDISVRYNYLYASGKANENNYGMRALYGSVVESNNNYISNVHIGLGAYWNSEIFSNINDDTGTQPNYGLVAYNAGLIAKNSTQPAGSLGNEFTGAAGVIL